MMDLLLAYFDPSAGSLLLQALVGGFGGIVVVARYLWLQFVGSKPAQDLQNLQEALSQSQEIPCYVPGHSR